MPYSLFTKRTKEGTKFCMRKKGGKTYCYRSKAARAKSQKIHEMFKHMPKSKIRIA